MNDTSTDPDMNSRKNLLIAAIAVGVIWQLPYGKLMLYPLSLLATYAHELGHGLAALLLGFDFARFYLHADGSGLAFWQGQAGRLASALIAAGGLLAPSIAGALLLALSRSVRRVRAVLYALAVLIAISVALWTRNLFGITFLLGFAALLALSAKYLADTGAAILLNIIAVTLCLSLFKDIDYMFSASALVDGTTHLSDTAQIAAALWLPYWFWGALLASLSLTLLAGGIWISCRPYPIKHRLD